MKTKKVYRSAETGEFVSEEEAKANPKETYKDTVPVKSEERYQTEEYQLPVLKEFDVLPAIDDVGGTASEFSELGREEK